MPRTLLKPYCDLRDLLRQVSDDPGIDNDEDRTALSQGHDSFEAVSAATKARAKEISSGQKKARARPIEKVPAELTKYAKYDHENLGAEERAQLIARPPRFFYFSTYELLPGQCDLHALHERGKTQQWEKGDETVSVRVAGYRVMPPSDVVPDQRACGRLPPATSCCPVQRRPATERPPDRALPKQRVSNR